MEPLDMSWERAERKTASKTALKRLTCQKVLFFFAVSTLKHGHWTGYDLVWEQLVKWSDSVDLTRQTGWPVGGCPGPSSPSPSAVRWWSPAFEAQRTECLHWRCREEGSRSVQVTKENKRWEEMERALTSHWWCVHPSPSADELWPPRLRAPYRSSPGWRPTHRESAAVQKG